MDEGYVLDRGVHVLAGGVHHREDEYDSRGFELLRRMQHDHFWFRGRHRFLAHAVRRFLKGSGRPSAVDLGGGCGGWINYLSERRGLSFGELALADSSRRALDVAAETLPRSVGRYQIDLLDLRWRDRWDVAFLLDVLEHIPEDGAALRQVAAALKPGGLLFVTTPALRAFWSWNDEVVGHRRRYGKADYRQLAAACGLEVCQLSYFMFFLSPLYAAARLTTGPRRRDLSAEEAWQLVERTHRVPAGPINLALSVAFAAESPLGHWLPFPWGTSILAVLRKPATAAAPALAA